MSETSTLIGYGGRTIGREELALVPTPAATETHRPIPHHKIVRALIETLGFRHIGVVDDEYAVSPDLPSIAYEQLPEMNGGMAAVRMKDSKPDVPVALLSSDECLPLSDLEAVDCFIPKSGFLRSVPRIDTH